MVLLMLRLIRTRGLDRIVITPIIVAGIAAVIAGDRVRRHDGAQPVRHARLTRT